jgi:transposase
MLHKVREMLVQQRTQLLNGLRGHLAEIGSLRIKPSTERRPQHHCNFIPLCCCAEYR